MTAPTPMTREELIELAALDAFGLLDEYEAALFTRSFHHAPAAVQDEIKDLQAAFASDSNLLPQVEPEADLRERVLDAVSKAIDAESVELAPLAMIGGRQHDRRAAVGRMAMAGSGSMWRAAAFVLAGVVLVVAYFNVHLYQRNEVMFNTILSYRAQGELDRLVGPGLLAFAENPNCIKRVLRPIDDDTELSAMVFINEQTEEAFLYALGITDQDEPYTLAAVTKTGETKFAHTFAGPGPIPITGEHLGQIAIASLAKTLIWEITDATGTVILRSA